MSFPVSDISQAYRSAPERTEDVWQKVKGHVLSRVRQQGAERQLAFSTLSLPTSSSLDSVVPGEEQPLPDMPSGASLQAAAGPGDQQRRASKHSLPGTRGMQGTEVMC